MYTKVKKGTLYTTYNLKITAQQIKRWSNYSHWWEAILMVESIRISVSLTVYINRYFSKLVTSVCSEEVFSVAELSWMKTLVFLHKNQNDIKTHNSVSCGQRSQRATPVSKLTGRTMMQFSCICNFMLLVQNWTIFAVEISSTVSTPHSKFQLNRARRLWDMNFQKLA